MLETLIHETGSRCGEAFQNTANVNLAHRVFQIFLQVTDAKDLIGCALFLLDDNVAFSSDF